MNKQSLKEKAIALEKAFIEYSKISNDIKRLSAYQPLVAAILDAKNGTINESRELQLSYWLFETDIQSYPVFEQALAEFSLELGGFNTE
ncbi:hypothetical protein [Methylophilus sp. QUAN]|uniref:hypothetical protein n=1 Tax=Methylophilus sp. QUAN TaxID=2781020 RepID=UPI00188EE71A|nr:hypothetical protein [Methylophilus sp. QUAN]MBF4992205.1 hypothetical protein [Methylophilus sp. QUAN]